MSTAASAKGVAGANEAMESIDRITWSPFVMGGKPCIRGMRITVGNIIGLLAAGHSTAEILDEFPELVEEDIRASLAYAAWSVGEIDLPLSISMGETC